MDSEAKTVEKIKEYKEQQFINDFIDFANANSELCRKSNKVKRIIVSSIANINIENLGEILITINIAPNEVIGMILNETYYGKFNISENNTEESIFVNRILDFKLEKLLLNMVNAVKFLCENIFVTTNEC